MTAGRSPTRLPVSSPLLVGLTLLCLTAGLGFLTASGERPAPHLAVGLSSATMLESGVARLTIDVNNATGGPVTAALQVDAVGGPAAPPRTLWADDMTVVPGRTIVNAEVREECGRRLEVRLVARGTTRRLTVLVPCPGVASLRDRA